MACTQVADAAVGAVASGRARLLRKMWADKTAEQAYAILEKPDVKVTNKKDKDVQLPKLAKLNEFAKSAVALEAPSDVVVSEL